MVAAQDTGVAYQAQRGGTLFTAIGGGDGVNAVVNDKSFSDHSAIYTTSQNLGPLERRIVDAQGRTGATTFFVTTKGSQNVLGFAPDDFTEASNPGGPLDSLPFSSKIVLNKIDPTMIAFGTNYVYTTIDANTRQQHARTHQPRHAGNPDRPDHGAGLWHHRHAQRRAGRVRARLLRRTR